MIDTRSAMPLDNPMTTPQSISSGSEALRPCPFCGGHAFAKRYYNGDTTLFEVSCQSCPAGMRGFDQSIADAIDAWNARTPAQRPSKPGPDDRPIPAYGQIPWDQLGRDVMDAMYATRSDYQFDESYYPGHQMVPQINFNSLARIVDKYRYYGASAVPSTNQKSST